MRKTPSEWSMPCWSDFGAIDILVNNAGITHDKTFLKMGRSIWDEVLGVNLTGTFNVTRACCPEWSRPAGGA